MNEVAIKANAEKNAVAVNFRASKSPRSGYSLSLLLLI